MGLVVYLIGSLRQPRVLDIASQLRKKGYEVFDDWYAAGPEADDKWQDYEKQRGRTYRQALQGHAAHHVWSYDKYHLDRSDCAVLVLPAGKSGHVELGYMAGRGKPSFVLLETEEPERWDVMYKFFTVCHTQEELIENLSGIEPSVAGSAEDREGDAAGAWTYSMQQLADGGDGAGDGGADRGSEAALQLSGSWRDSIGRPLNPRYPRAIR